MKSKSILIVMILMFAVALGAGVVAGKLSSRLPNGSTTPNEGPLTDILKLNADQRSRMQSIWEGVQRTSDECADKARAGQKEQDVEIKELLTPDQLEKYQKITMELQEKVGDLNKKRQEAFKKGVRDSLQLMTPEQQKLYRQIVQDRVGQAPEADLEGS